MTKLNRLKIINKKIDDLLSQMTLEEKIAQLRSYWI